MVSYRCGLCVRLLYAVREEALAVGLAAEVELGDGRVVLVDLILVCPLSADHLVAHAATALVREHVV
mgnify:CR=1 FL=1